MNRIAPGLIRKTSIEIDHIAQRRIQQAINQGGKEIEFVALKSLSELSKNFIKHLFDYSDNLVAKNMHKSNKKFRKFLIQNDKIYHGYFYRNKSCPRKLIDFERGEIWVCPTSNRYWRIDVKEKYLERN